jgi:hypothetical protein
MEKETSMQRSIPTIPSFVITALTFAVPLSLTLGPATGATTRAHRSRQPARHAPARGGAVALHPVELPDGSGTMQLPAGWRITGAIKGMVDAAGPQGVADLGLWCVVWTPQAAAQTFARPPVIASYGDPARAVQELLPQFSAGLRQSGQPGIRWIRLIEQTPTPWPNGKGAFLHFESAVDGKGRWQTVALVLMMPNGDGTWTYYTSSVSSPSAQFARNLPVLLQVWSHWKVADHVFQERLTHAMASMRETSRIIREANAYRQDAQDRSNRAWDLNIRGHWVYEDTETHERHEIDNAGVEKRVEALNRGAGYERYKVVPYHNLNR